MKAKHRITEEGKNKEKKNKEKIEAQEELEMEKKKRDQIDRKLQHLKKYDEYLNLVIADNHELYPTKAEIIQRHDTLKGSNDKLESSRENNEKKLDELKKEYIQYEKQTTDHLLQLNNEMAGLQKTIEVKST